MKKYITLSLLAALLCSCEIPFSIDDISEPRFMLECVPTSGEGSFNINIAYADPAYGKHIGTYSFNKSDISLEINDKAIKTDALQWVQNGNNLSTSITGNLLPGDKVSLSIAGAGGVPAAHASTIVPDTPGIAEVKIFRTDEKEEDSGARRFVVNMAEDIKEGQYYGIEICISKEMYFAKLDSLPPFIKLDTIQTSYYTTPGQVASMADINNMDLDSFAQVTYAYGGLINKSGSTYMEHRPMTLLTSKQFSDKVYYFYLSGNSSIFDFMDDIDIPEGGMADGDIPPAETPEPEEPWNPGFDTDPEAYEIYLGEKTWYELELFRLSEELYNYCKAQYLMNFNILSNFGVSPPNFTYSNVAGGLGIVGAISRSSSGKIPDPFNKEPEMPNLMDLLNLYK